MMKDHNKGMCLSKKSLINILKIIDLRPHGTKVEPTQDGRFPLSGIWFSCARGVELVQVPPPVLLSVRC